MYLFNGIGVGFDNLKTLKKMRYRGLMRAEARCRKMTSQDWLLGRFTPDHSAHSTFTLILHIFTSSLLHQWSRFCSVFSRSASCCRKPALGRMLRFWRISSRACQHNIICIILKIFLVQFGIKDLEFKITKSVYSRFAPWSPSSCAS